MKLFSKNHVEMKIAIAMLCLSLIAGFGAGYGIGIGKAFGFASGERNNAHRMSDGSVMLGTGGHSMDRMMDGMMADLDGKTGAEFEKAFLDGMIVHHEGAVAMARALEKNTTRPELLKMADDIVTVQTEEIATMKSWRTLWFGR